MGWIYAIICIVAAYRIYVRDIKSIFWIAVIVAIANVWSFGVMHNYRDNPYEAPNFWTNINMITAFIAIAFLIYSFF